MYGMAPSSAIMGRISGSVLVKRRSSQRAAIRACSETEPNFDIRDFAVLRFTSIVSLSPLVNLMNCMHSVVGSGGLIRRWVVVC